MTFQTTVRRQYTLGFPGDIVADGPRRAKPAVIVSATVGVDAGASTNRMTRAFGYAANPAMTGGTNATNEFTVVVGGTNFFGILGNSKNLALQGGVAGTLSPSLDLPRYATGEFFDMVTGMVVEVFNETTGAATVDFGDQIAYVSDQATVGQNPLALPHGALVAFPAGATIPAGFVLIPNARIVNPVTMGASGLGALVSTYTVAQLTQ